MRTEPIVESEVDDLLAISCLGDEVSSSRVTEVFLESEEYLTVLESVGGELDERIISRGRPTDESEVVSLDRVEDVESLVGLDSERRESGERHTAP